MMSPEISLIYREKGPFTANKKTGLKNRSHAKKKIPDWRR